jgi:uncharacterized membrane protein YhaH (DUF805 family)
MRGTLLAVAADGESIISGEDGKRYRMPRGEFRGGRPRERMVVDFVSERDVAREVFALTPEPIRLSFWQLWFGIKGRATRYDYWVRFLLAAFGLNLVAIIIDSVISVMTRMPAFSLFSALFGLFSLWPSLAVSIKRCHDRDHSGWFLLWGLVPLASIGAGLLVFLALDARRGTSAAVDALGPIALGMWGLIASGVWVWLWLELGFFRGTNGENSYGPDPLMSGR